MKKYLLPLILILFLAFTLIGDCVVTRVAYNEYTTDGGQNIQMTIPIGWDVGDCLIAYISKDDDIIVDELAGWTTLVSETAGTGNALYIAYRIAQLGDTNWTWFSTGDTNEDWLGEIICYTGNDTTDPIHASDFTVQAGTDNTPIAPSVSFTDLAAGSMVFQCFGQDTNDSPYTIPAQLTEIFKTGFGDTGGAGGDFSDFGWISPTGFTDPDTKWSDEPLAYNESTDDYAITTDNVPVNSWTSYLELNVDSISCDKVRFFAYYASSSITEISVDVYYSSGWHNIYEGIFASSEWVEKPIGSTQNVTAIRVKFYSIVSWQKALLKEVAFFKTVSGIGDTGTAVFGMNGTDTWVAATVIIEAEVEVGEVPPQVTGVSATDGDYTDKVVIIWDAANRATKYYVWTGAEWVDVGDVQTYDYTGAAAPTITAGTASATDGSSADYVTLSIAGESTNNGSSIDYKVKAWNATGYGADSATDAGYRGVGALTFQWERSSTDNDANYSEIDGATTDPYNDTGAPQNGDGRYYKCVENATGAAEQTTNVDRGFRISAAGITWNGITITKWNGVEITIPINTQ